MDRVLLKFLVFVGLMVNVSIFLKLWCFFIFFGFSFMVISFVFDIICLLNLIFSLWFIRMEIILLLCRESFLRDWIILLNGCFVDFGYMVIFIRVLLRCFVLFRFLSGMWILRLVCRLLGFSIVYLLNLWMVFINWVCLCEMMFMICFLLWVVFFLVSIIFIILLWMVCLIKCGGMNMLFFFLLFVIMKLVFFWVICSLFFIVLVLFW